ncbi:putative phosphoprotein [Anisopteromalus calandrae negative-strand RNA virus 2]|uniref:Phosphoprotein n=1 Tax=Anisopteromalus calandrae negative-strand RNA virus 2 TaxID=2848910 RepID=A0AAE7S442_9MONO|nr:putative phosphoprotein [Anisopteromalus calandrae negative-strand RNA virus 2]QWT43287.1 putative phosphoprotein [Anisopteromalus calandrae negative-strand RNA virus 2]
MPKHQKKSIMKGKGNSKREVGHKLKADVVNELSEYNIPDVGELPTLCLDNEVLELYSEVTKNPRDLTLIRRLREMVVGNPSASDLAKKAYVTAVVDDSGYFTANVEFEDIDTDIQDMFDEIPLLDVNASFENVENHEEDPGLATPSFEDAPNPATHPVATTPTTDLNTLIRRMNELISAVKSQSNLITSVDNLEKAIGVLTSDITEIKNRLSNIEAIASSTKTSVQTIEKRLGMAKEDIPKGQPLPSTTGAPSKVIHTPNLQKLYDTLITDHAIHASDENFAILTSMFETTNVCDIIKYAAQLGLKLTQDHAELLAVESLMTSNGARAALSALRTSEKIQPATVQDQSKASTSKSVVYNKPSFLKKKK